MASARCLWSKTRKSPKRESHRSIGTAASARSKSPPVCRHVWSCSRVLPKRPRVRLAHWVGKRRRAGGRQKSLLARRCAYTTTAKNLLLAGWWEVSAEAASMAYTIDQFLTSDRSPDSGARRVRNCDPRNLGPDCGSGQGLPQPGLCATFNEKQQK